MQGEAVVYLENELYANLQTGRVYNHTGYDVSMHFRSEVMDVRKTAENAESDGFAAVYLQNRKS